MIDFNFHQIMSWQRAKALLDDNAIGALRHVAVHWHVESRAIQLRMRSWKTLGDDGGGVLGNFISHCFHYLEWFCGPIDGLAARVSGLPDDSELETTVAMALQFAQGPLASLSMSCASYLGIGHRIEFFGEDGTLVLHNPGADYMRGFELFHAKRPSALRTHSGRGSGRREISRRPHRAGVAAGQHFPGRDRNAAAPATPGFAEGHRVQMLIDAARRSHQSGAWIDVSQQASKREPRVSRILVTGGSGFIGSGLVKALVRAGHTCACSTTIRAAARAASPK